MTDTQKIQKTRKLTAYNKKTTHDIFLMAMEWLEKYIEVAGYYSDWESRKQIRDNNIRRLDIVNNPKKAERDFLTQLYLFRATLKRNSIFCDELKEEFYQWISAAKIDAINCPDRLKFFLFGFNDVLEGNGEKIQRDVENSADELDSNSPEYMEQMGDVFVNIQVPMENEREIEKTLSKKAHNEWENKSEFESGKGEEGQLFFQQIYQEIAPKYNDFLFLPQKNQVKKNVSDEYSQWEREEEAREANVRKRSKWGSSLIDDENIDIVRAVRQHANNWKIETVQGQNWLIHNSAQRLESEIGTLIHNQQRFTDKEWAEIYQLISNSQHQIAQQEQLPPHEWKY